MNHKLVHFPMFLVCAFLSNSALGFWIISEDINLKTFTDGPHQVITREAINAYAIEINGQVYNFHPDVVEQFEVDNKYRWWGDKK